ncbi:MAG: AAA family ATPase [Fibrobacterales bacterium]
MDKLLQTRCWFEKIGPTEAAQKGGLRQHERDDFLFTTVYLLLEAGFIDGAHLALTDLSNRLMGEDERDAERTLVELLIVATTEMGHLFYVLGVSGRDLVDALAGVVVNRIQNAKDIVVAEQLQSLCDSTALTDGFSKAFSHVVETVARQRPVFSLPGTQSSLFVYDAQYGFYTGKYYDVEKRLSLWLTMKIDNKPLELSTELKKIYQEVFVEQPMMLGDIPMQFHVRQQVAVLMAAQKQFSIISGGPGTGKTSTVVALLRVLVRAYPELRADEITMVAPTGRAAARMAESVEQSVALISNLEHQVSDAKLCAINAQTIHRFLKYNPGRNQFTYGRDNKHPTKILIVDEVSMVDAALFLNVAEALQPDTRIILLGDHNQLPSVQAGAVLSDLFGATIPQGNPSLSKESVLALVNEISVEEDLENDSSSLVLEEDHLLKDSMVVLSKSHRSEASILTLSSAINSQDVDATNQILSRVSGIPAWPQVVINADGSKRCDTEGVVFIQRGEKTKERNPLNDLLIDWCRFHMVDESFAPEAGVNKVLLRTHAYPDIIAGIEKRLTGVQTASEIVKKASEDSALQNLFSELFAYMNQSQILGVTRNGPVGTTTINQVLFEYMQGVLAYEIRDGVYPGLPIIITQNDYAHGIFNGDCGVVISAGGSYYIVIPNRDTVSVYPVSEISRFESAYAITVHKSQGSEYDYALIVLPSEMNRVMTKEILYTAVTRAKYYVGVLGSDHSIRDCIGRSIRRNSAISRRFKQSIDSNL